MGLDARAPLPLNYFQQADVVALARDLLGRYLVTEIEGKRTVGRITETEAYAGYGDKACHAHMERKTKRNQIMYAAGGHAYVYLCYGIHHLFNIVTNREGQADAVLLRAVEPLEGIQHMLKRRGLEQPLPRLTAGPGNMSKALGITTALYGRLLDAPELQVQAGRPLPDASVEAAPRVGIGYAGEDALLPWRFYERHQRYVSKK
jgi:DNA-3-methyladenine glycosylase